MDQQRRSFLQFLGSIFFVSPNVVIDQQATPSREMRVGLRDITSADHREIQTVLQRYVRATLDRNADGATACVSRETVAFYDRQVDLARTASRNELETCDFLSHLMAVRIRHEFTREQIRTLTGRRLFWHAIAAQKLDRRSVRAMAEHLEVDRCCTDGLTTWCTLRDAPESFRLYFACDDNIWKVDLTPAFPRLIQEMEGDFKEWHRSRDEVINSILWMLTKREVAAKHFGHPT